MTVAPPVAPDGLDPLEVAVGQVLGLEAADPPPRSPRGRARAVLEAALVDALSHPPCGVSFSGGRDSSTILALAVEVARREGLPAPVALTLRFPDVPSTEEDGWQEAVVAHVGIDDWERVEVHDELELVGPHAQRSVTALGARYPLNAYAQLPLLERVPGGTLLTGVGGDEVLGTTAEHVVRVACGRARPHRDDARYVASLLRRGRAEVYLGDSFLDMPWLRPDAVTAARRREGAAVAALGLHWGRALRRWTASRYLRATRRTLAAVGDLAGARARAPFLDLDFVAAMAADGGAAGFAERSAAIEHVVGDLLPAPVRTRVSKASFGRAFLGPRTVAHVAALDPARFDDDLVDGSALVAGWLGPSVDVRSWLLLHDALAADLANGRVGSGGERPQLVDHGGQVLEAAGSLQPGHRQGGHVEQPLG